MGKTRKWGAEKNTHTHTLRTLFPLTAFKNARNPEFVQICPSDCFWGFQSGGLKFGKICQNLKNGNFRTNFDNFFQISVPLTGTPKNNRWDKFWTNLGFRAFLNAVRGKRVRNTHTQEKKHVNKNFTGLSRDFGGEFCLCVFLFSPIRNDPKK